MEEIYAEFMQGAADSLTDKYAENVLAAVSYSENETGGMINSIINVLGTSLKEAFSLPDCFKGAVALLVVLVILNVIKDSLKSQNTYKFSLYFVNLVLVLTVTLPLYEVLSDCRTYMQNISLFLGTLFPTIGILTAAGGNIITAQANSIFSSLFLSVAQYLINTAVPGVITVFVGLAFIGTVAEDREMLSISKFAKNFLFGLFSIVTAVFFIVVGSQNMAVSSLDTASAKTLKLLVSNAVPIVGGTIGDALRLVGGSLITVKNATGMTAVLFLLSMFLPVLIKLFAYSFFLSLFAFVSEYFGISGAKTFFGHIKCAFDFCIAAFSSVFVIGMLNIGIFLGTMPSVTTI